MRASRRALIPTADLRRSARIARDEGVAINWAINDDGVSITVSPLDPSADRGNNDDFDAKVTKFLRK